MSRNKTWNIRCGIHTETFSESFSYAIAKNKTKISSFSCFQKREREKDSFHNLSHFNIQRVFAHWCVHFPTKYQTCVEPTFSCVGKLFLDLLVKVVLATSIAFHLFHFSKKIIIIFGFVAFSQEEMGVLKCLWFFYLKLESYATNSLTKSYVSRTVRSSLHLLLF